jgi:hypothetical protein
MTDDTRASMPYEPAFEEVLSPSAVGVFVTEQEERIRKAELSLLKFHPWWCCSVLLCLLLLAGNAWAADTHLCADDDKNGTIDILKGVGVPDRDCDGELSVADGGYDCDDTNPRIFNNQYVRVSSTLYKQCVNGSYSSDTSAQLCERGTCYYVDTDTGSDANDCSWASPCASFAKLTTGGSIAMAADTAIYLKGSADYTTYTARTPDGGDGCNRIGWESEAAGTSSASKNIIALYPTSTANLSPNCPNTTDCCKGVKVGHNNWIVRDLDINGFFNSGVLITNGADNIEVENVRIYDIQGEAANNIACFNACDGCDSLDVHHIFGYDCYDPTKTASGDDRQNVGIVNFFGNSQDQVVRYSRIGYSVAPESSPYEKGGFGIRWKHGNQPSDMTLYNKALGNITSNVTYGIAANGAKTTVQGNLVLDVPLCFASLDQAGGDGYFLDGLAFEDNTCVTIDSSVGTNRAVAFGGAYTTTPTIANSIARNVIYNNETSYSSERNMVRVNPYGTTAEYTAMITNGYLQIENNCYYNPTYSAGGLSNGFNIYGYGDGTVSNFATYQSTYGFDTPGGYNENPSLDSSYRATSTNCDGKGWEGYWPTTTTTTTTTTTVPAGGGYIAAIY